MSSVSGQCRNCIEKKNRRMWKCNGCGEVKCAHEDYSEWLKKRKTETYAANARCNDCRSRIMEKEQAQRRKDVALVMKISDTSSQVPVVKLDRERDDAADQAVMPCKICEKRSRV